MSIENESQNIPRKTVARLARKFHNASKLLFAKFKIRERNHDGIQRQQFEKILKEFLPVNSNETNPDDCFLIDGCWDNPNWWWRCHLILNALNTNGAKKKGVLGFSNNEKVRTTFDKLDIEPYEIKDFCQPKKNYIKLAEGYLNQIKTNGDILNLAFHRDIPNFIIYDWLLKRQQSPSVNIKHKMLTEDIVLAMQTIDACYEIIKVTKPKVLVISHACGLPYAALIMAALQKKIKIIVGHAEYSLSRFWKIENQSDLPYLANVPSAKDINALTYIQRKNLIETGKAYLKRRKKGFAVDIGAKYKDKAKECYERGDIKRHFNWEKNQPIIVIYSMSWFDYPHIYGDLYFRDPLDWLESTLRKINQINNCYWLLRPHPMDQWYQKLTLHDLLPNELPKHIGLVPFSWNGDALMESVDGMVTMYGTAGIEYAASGIPVLVGSKGWYGDCGFVVCPKSRDDYLNKLGEKWWESDKIEERKELAQIFAGWHFCGPDWQQNFFMKDDSAQSQIYFDFDKFLFNNKEPIKVEMETIKQWFTQNQVSGYHSYKMKAASDYQLGNTN